MGRAGDDGLVLLTGSVSEPKAELSGRFITVSMEAWKQTHTAHTRAWMHKNSYSAVARHREIHLLGYMET